jgi:hypothetical protein
VQTSSVLVVIPSVHTNTARVYMPTSSTFMHNHTKYNQQHTDTRTHICYYCTLHQPLRTQDPLALVKVLEDTDPFGVYQTAEPGGLWDGSAGALLEKTGIAFTCPSKPERLSEPDLRNHTAEAVFKEGGEAFLYFQHIRKVS